jgi:hypothetical protein
MGIVFTFKQKDMNTLNSKRKFSVVGFERVTFNGFEPFEHELLLDELLNLDWEIVYSMLDHTDKILDLKLNESIVLQSDRSDNLTRMVVTRVA